MLASRDIVYAVIDGERQYQDDQQGNAKAHENRIGGPEKPMDTGSFLLCMEKCLADAREAWYKPDGGTTCLPFVRKVAALAVATMEHYGAPPRQGYEPTP